MTRPYTRKTVDAPDAGLPSIDHLTAFLPPVDDERLLILACRWLQALPDIIHCPAAEGVPSDIAAAAVRAWCLAFGVGAAIRSTTVIAAAAHVGVARHKAGAQTLLGLKTAPLVNAMDRWTGMKMSRHTEEDAAIDKALKVIGRFVHDT